MKRGRLLALLLVALWAAAPTPRASADAGFEDAIPETPSLESRLARIQARIRDALVYPPVARRQSIEGEARIGFAIGADGSAREIELVRSSGHSLLDRAAERAVRDARGLPPVFGRLEVPVRFELEDAD